MMHCSLVTQWSRQHAHLLSHALTNDFFSPFVQHKVRVPTASHTNHCRRSAVAMDGQSPTPKSGSTGRVEIHMSKGDEEDSYSKNSEVQNLLIERAVIPNLDETLAQLPLPVNGRPVILADLGCSSGPNAVLLVSQIVDKLKERKSSSEFQAFFNDLPSNDFNNLFHLLSSGDVKRSSFFSAGVPGSFFDPLFPQSAIHVFISTFAMQFLSQIPASVLDKGAAAFNKGTWWASGCGSSVGLNKEAASAFQDQSLKDMDTFLKLRAAELVPGGLLCFALITRWDSELSRVETSVETCFRCVDNALKKLTKEGIVHEDHSDFFNIPMFFHTTGELEQLVLKYRSTFEVVTFKETKVELFVDFGAGRNQESSQIIQSAVGIIRGAFGGMIRRQLGEEAANFLFEYLEREATANVKGLSQETPIVFVALKKKVNGA